MMRYHSGCCAWNGQKKSKPGDRTGGVTQVKGSGGLDGQCVSGHIPEIFRA